MIKKNKTVLPQKIVAKSKKKNKKNRKIENQKRNENKLGRKGKEKRYASRQH